MKVDGVAVPTERQLRKAHELLYREYGEDLYYRLGTAMVRVGFENSVSRPGGWPGSGG